MKKGPERDLFSWGGGGLFPAGYDGFSGRAGGDTRGCSGGPTNRIGTEVARHGDNGTRGYILAQFFCGNRDGAMFRIRTFGERYGLHFTGQWRGALGELALVGGTEFRFIVATGRYTGNGPCGFVSTR